VLDLLASLVDKSLVVMEERAGEVRYRMLETIRQYAQEQLGPEERVTAMRRMRDYFAAFVQDLRFEQFKKDGVWWLARAETEFDNLRCVLDFCLEDRPSLQHGFKIAGYLNHFWEVRGFASEGRHWLECLLEADREKRPTLERFEAVSIAGMLARGHGDYPVA